MSPHLEIESDTASDRTRKKLRAGKGLPAPAKGKLKPKTPEREERQAVRNQANLPDERPWLHVDNPALWEGDTDDD